MKKTLFTAFLFAALSLGFVSCENPDDEPGFSLENVGEDDDKNPDGSVTPPSTPEEPILVATGDATDVEYSSVTLWGRLNTDTLVFFPNIKWGVEYSTSKEEITTHSGKRALCTTELVGANADEFSVKLTGVGYGKKLYYNAYLLINDIKYVYGEMDSVHMDVKLILKANNSNYGTVTGSGYYDVGSEATITATPEENCYFTGWSDSDTKELTRTVQVNSDTIIIANFAKNPYLTAKPNSSDYGTVTGSGYYDVGSEATITATPNPKYDYIEFVQWNDGNTENPRTVTITTDVTYTANFKVNLPDGAFLVNSSGKCVVFSPGNLQYTQSTNTWSFAENQWDYIGTDNVTDDVVGWVTSLEYGDEKDGTALADKIDLFGWSTSARCSFFGVNTLSEHAEANSGSFVDWGTNQIGSDAPNTWRTLTYNEWEYVVFDRPNASSLRGAAQVNGVNGLILLPDSWTCPDGITFKSGFYDDYYGVKYYAAYQTFTADQWSKMEAAGAVFLPASGYRYCSDVNNVQYRGNYWSSTEYEYRSYCVYEFVFTSSGAGMDGDDWSHGQSVRLVKDL